MGRDIKSMYENVAFVYDAWTWSTERRSLRAALDRIALVDGESVLEVAVGTGVFFRDILKRNRSGRNVGVDLTAGMLRRARRKAERVSTTFELLVADARALPFPDASFDVVVNNNMLGLLADADIAPILGEMYRVLRPGGRVLIVTMMRPNRRLPALVYDIGAVRLGGWHDVRPEPFVRAAGFEVREQKTVQQLGIPSEILVGRKG